MKKSSLIKTFDNAILEKSKFVFVFLIAEDVKEVICIPHFSLEDKIIFYENAYDEDLKHVMNKDVFITNVLHGDSDVLNNIKEMK